MSNFISLKSVKNFHIGTLTIIILMLLMTILPLPPFLLDLLFTSNITLSLIVLMVCIYVYRPLELSVFPTILLVTTLLRLTLNIASTRVVLLHGHQGPSAAGQVIKAFGEVVIGGNFVVGVIVFSILMIINFVVITKGAGRISEVSARFTLDAMPGKQMSVDADLNAGVISQEEAKKRRIEIIHEADFYGSMDGASKFIRGDAIAGMLILFINLIGGIIIGMFQHGMPIEIAAKNFSILTIGDGLVAQIPSLLMSISAAIMVTRVSNEQDIREQTISQLFSNPKPLSITAAILFIIAFIPNMPHVSFFMLGSVSMLISYLIFNKDNKAKSKLASETNHMNPSVRPDTHEVDWDEVVSTDRITLEIGYHLISLVGVNKDGLLINRIKGIRRKVSQELGFLIPTIHVKDNLNLASNAYRIYLKGVVIAESIIYPEKYMAINPGHIRFLLEGSACKDPTFGLDAWWIDASQRDYAIGLGFTVVDASTVIATHLNHVIRTNSSHLLGYDEVQQLLNKLTTVTPKLVETLTSSAQGVPLHVIVTVLQRLLQSNIPLIDMRTIAEKLIETWSKTKDFELLVESIRVSLKHLIIYSICSDQKELPVAVFDNELAQILHKSIQQAQDGTGERMVVLEPSLTERIYVRLLEYVRQCELESMPSIVLVTRELRGMLEKLFKPGIPSMHFLSHNEIPDDRQLNVIAKIG